MHTPEGAQRQKKTENWVAKKLQEAKFAVLEREVTIEFKCLDSPGKSARIDHPLHFEEHISLTETDEHQHQGYPVSCEVRRMMDVVAALRCSGDTRKILWVRFNPDAFSVDGARKRVSRKDKMARLVEFLRNYKPTQPVEIAYLFYDTTNGKPEIFNDTDFPSEVKEMVTHVIV